MKSYITFQTTFEAMRFWRVAQAEGISGKLGPAPRSLQAACAIAWITELEGRAAALESAKRHGIPVSQEVSK